MTRNTMSPSLSVRIGGLVAAAVALVLVPTMADARGGRGGGGGGMRASAGGGMRASGGGMRASGRTSVSRGGGGYSGGNRNMSADRGGRSFQSGGNFQGGGSRATGARTGDRTNIASGGRDRTNIGTGDRTIGGGDRRTNIDRGDRTNIRGGNNINTGDINIDGDHGWYDGDGWGHHPIAAGVAFGTAAAVTSAAIGSMYYSLPPGCPPYPYGGYTYYNCGGAWYAPQYSGSSVTYVVVEDPH